MILRALISTSFLSATTVLLHAEVDFRRQVLPILDKSCMDCHKAPAKDNSGKMQNPKGGLRLDGASFILKGGSDGSGVEPGDPDKSLIYQRVLLPPEHEDSMPPKGKGKPLTFSETEILKNWISEGANFGEWKGAGEAPAPAPAGGGAAKKSDDPLAAGVSVVPAEALQKVASLGGIAGPVALGSKLLRVEWVSGNSGITDKEAANLKALGPNITELDLSSTKITDETLKLIGTFTRLTRLDLSTTAITDAGLAQLGKLTNLESLNLHDTAISDAGIAALKPLRKLKKVYLWKTRVTESSAGDLQKSIPGSTIVIN